MPYYSHSSAIPVSQSRGTSSSMRAEFDAVAAGFTAVQTDIATIAAAAGISLSVAENTIAASNVTTIGSVVGNVVSITGSTAISSFGLVYTNPKFIRFTGACTLVASSTLLLPAGVNITTVAGDSCVAVPIGNPCTGWRLDNYRRNSVTGYQAIDVSSTATGSIVATNVQAAIAELDAKKAALGANSDITSLSAVTSINSGYLYGNRVINGAMEIDQVNSGTAVTPATTAAFIYLTDMFGALNSQASKLTYQQVVDAPAGLKNSMKVTVAAQYAPISTDYFLLQTAIEGKDVIDFQLGTSGAATITLSNYIKSSVAGTYAVSLQNFANNRSYVGTVSVTTSWAQVKVTLQGDATGTWLTDSTIGLRLTWDLGSGTNYNGTAGAWAAGNAIRTSGSVTFVNQVAGSTLNITGVDCRLGSVAPTVFERRPNELQLAQRYYEIGNANLSAYIQAAQYSKVPITFKVTKRAVPSILYGTPGTNINTSTYGFDAVNQTDMRFFMQAAALGISEIAFLPWVARAPLF